MKKLSLILMILISSYGMLRAQESSLVYPGTDGKLVYTPHAFTAETEAVHIIPDFSFAGYKNGGVELPVGDVPVKVTLNPQPSGEDRTRIQAAIDQVSAMPLDANGFRGAILLTAGTYRLNDGNIPVESGGKGAALTIAASGVVLRGEGQGIDGTILYSSFDREHTMITLKKSFSETTSNTQRVTTNYVGTGQKTFDVADASGYSVGDTLLVVFTPNQQWLDDIKVNDYITNPADYWDTPTFSTGSNRKITAINGNTITVECPLVQPLQARHGGGEVSKIITSGRLSNIGVEDLRILGADLSISGATSASRLRVGIRAWKISDSWVHGVTVVHASESTVMVNTSVNFTGEELAYLQPYGPISGGWRYPYTLVGDASRVLFQRCFSEEARHDVVTNNRIPGPNVFLDIVCIKGKNVLGPHARWATGTLFDNIKSETRMELNEFNLYDGHGWCGAQTVGWNLDCIEYVNDAAEGSQNYAIGCIGSEESGHVDNSNAGIYRGFYESHGTHVATRSLYLKQLDDRLGSAAVANIAIPRQLTGDIYAMVSSWAGEGAFPVAPAPTNIAVASASSISWIDIATDETGFVVERSTDMGSTFTQVAQLPANTEQYVETEELIGVCVYRVKSLHSNGTSTYTDEVRILFAGDNAISYAPVEDAYVRGGTNENSNYGSETDLLVKKSGSVNNYRKTLIQFDLSQEGLNSADIQQAALRVYLSSVDGEMTVTAREMLDTWDEATVTFAAAPGGDVHIDAVKISSGGQYILWDMTDYIKSQVSGDGVVSVHLYDLEKTANLAYFNSKEASNNTPELVISKSSVPAQDYTYNPTEDSYIRGDIYGDDNFGSNAELGVKKGNAEKHKRKTFVKFDLSGEGLSNVSNATLRLYASRVDASVTLSALELDDNWSESTLTWNNAQDMTTVINTTPLAAENVYYEFDVTAFAQAQLASDGIVSIGIMDKTTSNVTVEFNSKEVGSNKPELVITGSKAANKYGKVADLKPTQENQRPAVKVYPNPSKGYVNIQFANSNLQLVTVVLYGINGQMLLQKRFNAKTGGYKLDLTAINQGLYMLKVEYDNNTIVKKISVK